jgi:hypothetical protein
MMKSRQWAPRSASVLAAWQPRSPRSALREDLPRLLALIREVFTEPTFPARQFQRIKTQLLTFLSIQAQDTAAMADQAFDRAIYRSPLRHTRTWIPAHLADDYPRRPEDFHQRFLGPKAWWSPFAGACNPEALGF